MKPQSLVIGRTNAGKTMFCLQFAKYLGIREFTWLMERADGHVEQRRMKISDAITALASPEPHRTRQLQSLFVDVPRGKGTRQLKVTDTTGLSDGVHEDPQVRQAMAQTLRAMVDTQIVFHVVDANSLGRFGSANDTRSAFLPLDRQLIDYGATRTNYVILANKMDLPAAAAGLGLIRRTFPKLRVIPVSALAGNGFREVKRYVWRLG